MLGLLSSHLPRVLCRQLEYSLTGDAALHGVVLHVEIPGLSAAFDAVAPPERLSRPPHLDGAREALNSVFGHLVSILQQWGADVWSLEALSHGVVTALWADRSHQRGGSDESAARLIERAGACAAVLRECHPQLEVTTGVSLPVWIGLTCGPLSVVDLDVDGERRMVLLAGDPLSRLHDMGFPHPEPPLQPAEPAGDRPDAPRRGSSASAPPAPLAASPRRPPPPAGGGLVVCSRAWGVLSALSFFSGRAGVGGHVRVDAVLPSAFLYPPPPFPADLYPPDAAEAAPHFGRVLKPYLPAALLARAAAGASLVRLQGWAAEGSLTAVVYLRLACRPPSLHHALAAGDQRAAREAALDCEAALRTVQSVLGQYEGTLRSYTVEPSGDGLLVASFELHGQSPAVPFAPGGPGHHALAHLSPPPLSPSPVAVDDSVEVEGDDFGLELRSVSPDTHVKSLFLPFSLAAGEPPHSARHPRLQSPAARAVGAVLEARQRLRELGVRCGRPGAWAGARRGGRASAGVGTGLVAQVPVGTDARRAYGLVGRAVALASRLLDAARDDVLCDEATRVGAGGAVRFEPAAGPDRGDGAGPHALACHRALWHAAAVEVAAAPSGERLVGRAAESGALGEQLSALLRGGRGGLVLLEGPEGCGKSRLLEELARVALALAQRCARAEAEPPPPACPPWTAASAVRQPPAPYGPWRALFRQLLALPPFAGFVADLEALCAPAGEEAGRGPSTRRAPPLLSTVVDLSAEPPAGERTAPRPLFVPESPFFRANPDLWRLAPLLADLLPPPLAALAARSETELTAGMRAEAREDAVREAAVRVLEAAAADGPLLLLLDGDGSRLDGPSAALLEAALKRCGALLAVAATRRPLAGEAAPARRTPLGRAAASLASHGRDVATVRLPALPLAETAALLALRLQVPRVPPALASAVWAASGGGALLAELLAAHLRDTVPDLKRLLEVSPTLPPRATPAPSVRGQLPEGAPVPREAGELPATLEAAAEARIRRLAAPEAAALEAAAVAGWRFSLLHLFHLLGARTDKDRALAYDHFAALLQADLVAPVPPPPAPAAPDAAPATHAATGPAPARAGVPKGRGGPAGGPAGPEGTAGAGAGPPAVYAFRHECVWAAAYGRIEAGRRGELHAAAAAFLEARPAAEPAPGPGALALHWCHAWGALGARPAGTPRAALGAAAGDERGARALALHHAERAAAAAGRCGAHAEAAALYARLLHLHALPARPPPRELWRWPAPSPAPEPSPAGPPAAWEAALADSLLRLGQPREAAAALRRALRLAGQGAVPRDGLPLRAATALRWLRHAVRPVPWLEAPPAAPAAPAAAAGEGAAAAEAARLFGRLAAVSFQEGEAREGTYAALHALQLAARTAGPAFRGEAARALSAVAAAALLLAPSLPALVPRARRLPFLLAARARRALAVAEGAGRPEAAGRELREAWEAQARGLVPPPVPTSPLFPAPGALPPADADAGATAALAAASLALASARFREAAEAAGAALAHFDALCDRARREQCLALAALADLSTGAYARASLAAEEAAASARLRGDPAAAHRACLLHVHCLLPRGRLDEAAALLHSADALFARGSPAGARPVASYPALGPGGEDGAGGAAGASPSHAAALRALVAHRSGDTAAAVPLALAAVAALAARVDPAAAAAAARPQPPATARAPPGDEEAEASTRGGLLCCGAWPRRSVGPDGLPRARARGGRGVDVEAAPREVAAAAACAAAAGGWPADTFPWAAAAGWGLLPLAALAEVLLSALLAASPAPGAPGEPGGSRRGEEAAAGGPEAGRLEWACRALVGWLLGIGRLLPVAIPTAEYWLGVLHAAGGRLAEAKRQWKHCIRGAEKAGMLREVGLGHLAIAKHAPSSADSARHHIARAADAFGKIEASYDLALCLL